MFVFWFGVVFIHFACWHGRLTARCALQVQLNSTQEIGSGARATRELLKNHCAGLISLSNTGNKREQKSTRAHIHTLSSKLKEGLTEHPDLRS